MIFMLIAHAEKNERQYMMLYTKELAAHYTEENWKILPCGDAAGLKKLLAQTDHTDFLCADITLEGLLEEVKAFREKEKDAYLILVASPDMSPVTYLRPSVGAQSLLLKPLTKNKIHDIFSEAVSTYTKRLQSPDEESFFVVESGGEKSLIRRDAIFYFESRDKRVYLNTETKDYGFYETLENLGVRLGSAFLRCHRSFLVNKAKIKSIFLSQNRMVLEKGVEIPLSRSYKPLVKAYLKESDKAHA